MKPRNTKHGASANAQRAPKGADRSVSFATKPSPKAKKHPSGSAKKQQLFVPRWWMLPIVILALLAFFVATYYPVARVQYRETRERVRLEAELQALKARNARLRAAVDRLKTPEGVEDYARLQLGMVKKGEHVAVVIDGDETTQSALAAPSTSRIDSEEAAAPPVGPWTAFLDVVFAVE